MFKRDFEKILLEYTQFPVIGILGPRQSGKTTLAQQTFKNHKYTNFEDPDTRLMAKNDPRNFLSTYENEHGIIIDEFQYVPEILSYIQLEVDAKKRPGYFVLTGSQNFLVNQAITQSLAGRIGILTLLPLSLHELEKNKILPQSVDKTLFNGFYPRIYDEKIAAEKLYPSYIQSYIERDVRLLINVGDLTTFIKFIKLCAGRIGQLLNLSDIAAVCGISVDTCKRWISLLEASYVIFLLQPHFNNFNKRLTKSPKLYFFDTGLACSLLEIESPEALALHAMKGNLFECFIIADVYKQYANIGKRPPLYFWRDLNGRLEMDLVIEQDQKLYPIEIKSSQTIASDFFSGLESWGQLSGVGPENRFLIYGGDLKQQRTYAHIIGWKQSATFVEELRKKLP